MPNPRGHYRRLFWRGVGFAAGSVGLGVLWGAVAGSIVPIAGTFFGGVIGGLNGLVLGTIAAPFIASRPLGRVFKRLTVVCTPIAVICAAFGLYTVFVSASSDGITAVWAGYGCTTIAYVFVVIHARTTLPPVRRRVRAGRCVGCGYAVAGLAAPRCPECGRVLSRAEWAMPQTPGDRARDGSTNPTRPVSG